jgi:hypothetical protein
MTQNEVKQHTLKKLTKLKQFGLMSGEYAVAGSAPMAIRGLRMMNDIDLIVTKKQWDVLSKKYPVVHKSVTKIVLPGEIDVLSDITFPNADPQAPTIQDGIDTSENIEGYPVISFDHMLWYKERSGREKDLNDIKLIKTWQANNKI